MLLHFSCADMIPAPELLLHVTSFTNTGLKWLDSLTPPLRFQVNIKQSIGHGRGVDM